MGMSPSVIHHYSNLPKSKHHALLGFAAGLCVVKGDWVLSVRYLLRPSSAAVGKGILLSQIEVILPTWYFVLSSLLHMFDIDNTSV